MKKDILPELLYKWYLEAKENLNGKRFSELSNKQKTIFIYLAQRVNKIEQARDKWVLEQVPEKRKSLYPKSLVDNDTWWDRGYNRALDDIRKIFKGE